MHVPRIARHVERREATLRNFIRKATNVAYD
jgi:hypothetical protein